MPSVFPVPLIILSVLLTAFAESTSLSPFFIALLANFPPEPISPTIGTIEKPEIPALTRSPS